MSEQHTVPETATPEVIDPRIQVACDIATGKQMADPAETGVWITGAARNISCRGKGSEWYKMVYRDHAWRYVSDDRLPPGKFLAADRHARVYGTVYTGEVVVSHKRGEAVDGAWLICGLLSDGTQLIEVEYMKRRDGDLAFILPDESKVVLPDPRRK